MSKALLMVRYRVCGDPVRFRDDMEKAAPALAAVPGIVWKIWGLDTDRGAGLSAYLFDTLLAAEGFAAGPVIERLRGRPDVAEVSVELAPVDHGLSALTGAGPALAAPATVPAL